MNIVNERYMREAIRLARKAEGMTSPNPIVGALIVKNGKVVGRGYHHKAGLPHAEVNAIKQAGEKAKGAAMYVTLEPCNHYGRTPPCTEAIVKSGIRRIYIGMRDPNPLTNGSGIRQLKKYGIMTKTGILEDKINLMNAPFTKYIRKKLPYITVKIAESLDGKIATRSGDSRWISSEESRRHVQSMRKHSDAVMVGVNTIIRDNPTLLSKIPGAKQPIRIIVDSRLRTPLGSNILRPIPGSPVYIATLNNAPRQKKYEDRGVKIIKVGSRGGKVNLTALLRILAKECIMNILVEGGGELTAGLIEEGLVDKVVFFIAPKFIGGRDAPTPLEGKGVGLMSEAIAVRWGTVKKTGPDIFIEGFIVNKK